MPKGGARNRSGRQPDPNSLRGAGRAPLTPLPSEGYRGAFPDFPLPMPSKRELALWEWAWRTPQAAAWIREPWRHNTVANWVRWSVRAEGKKCSATVITAAIRVADQIGMTPAGLKENGWAIAADELGDRRQADETGDVEVSDFALKVASGGDA